MNTETVLGFIAVMVFVILIYSRLIWTQVYKISKGLDEVLEKINKSKIL